MTSKPARRSPARRRRRPPIACKNLHCLLGCPTSESLGQTHGTLYSQRSPRWPNDTHDVVRDRLELRFTATRTQHKPAKFIYLDMEEYKDLYSDGADALENESSLRRGLEQTSAGRVPAASHPTPTLSCKTFIEWSRKTGRRRRQAR